jgi:CRP/FNR family cyclic AMP-dependent transcriptional regulator
MTGTDSQEAKVKLAAATDIFQDLDPEELELVAVSMEPVQFEAGDEIMKEGEMGGSMFLIAEGEVEVHKALTMKFGQDDFRETEKTLSVLKQSDHAVFGEMALVAELERSATVTARTKTTLYQIDRESFLDLARQNPSLGFKVTLRLAELLSTRLKKSGEDVIRLTTALSIALSQ